MAWFVYDFDADGNKYQRGPFPTETISQSILDQCESPNAEMHFWNTINKAEAKKQFNELLLERKKGISGSLKRFKSTKFLSNSKSDSNVQLTNLENPKDNGISDIRNKVAQVRNSVKVDINPVI